MKVVTNEELKQIYGGAISSSLITAMVRAVNGLLDLGRSLGTAIRRVQTGKICPL